MAARALLSNAVVVTALIATLTLLALNLSGPPGAPGTLNGYGYKDIVRTEEIARLLRYPHNTPPLPPHTHALLSTSATLCCCALRSCSSFRSG